MLNVVIIQLVLLTAAVPSTDCSTADEGGEVMNRHRRSDPDDPINARLHYGLLIAIRGEEARQRARNNLETVTSSNSSPEDEEGEVMDRNQTTTSESMGDRLHKSLIKSIKKVQREIRKRQRTKAYRKRGRKGGPRYEEDKVESADLISLNDPLIRQIRNSLIGTIKYLQFRQSARNNSGTVNSTEKFIFTPETDNSTERFICNPEIVNSTETFICNPETINSTESIIHSLGTLNPNDLLIRLIRDSLMGAIEIIQDEHFDDGVNSTVRFICNPETLNSTGRFICNPEIVNSTETFICNPETVNSTETFICNPETVNSTETFVRRSETINSAERLTCDPKTINSAESFICNPETMDLSRDSSAIRKQSILPRDSSAIRK